MGPAEPLSFLALISRGPESRGARATIALVGWEQREPQPSVFAVQLHGSVPVTGEELSTTSTCISTSCARSMCIFW